MIWTTLRRKLLRRCRGSTEILKINWNLIYLFLIGAVVIAFAVFTLPRKSDKSNPDQLLLELCKKVINEVTSEDISNVPVKMVPVGGGKTRYGYRQTLALWQNEELKVDIRCVGRGLSNMSGTPVIDQLIVNDEDKTNLIRREERK